VDHKKAGKLAAAIQAAFQGMGVFQNSVTRMPNLEDAIPFGTVPTVIASRSDGPLGGEGEGNNLAQLQHELEIILAAEIARKEISMGRELDGLVISLREAGFFESGSAQRKQASAPAFDRIAALLRKRKCRLRIEGHTDNIPIHNARFSSNWELSTSRATEIVRLLIVRDGFDAYL
jgi:chemotaxis protein MotB